MAPSWATVLLAKTLKHAKSVPIGIPSAFVRSADLGFRVLLQVEAYQDASQSTQIPEYQGIVSGYPGPGYPGRDSY
eukprot:2601412-Rhodomonas_salina.2